VHALGGDPGHRPGYSDRIEALQRHAGLLHRLARRASRRILAWIHDAGDGLQHAVAAGGVEDGGAQLTHQHGGAPLRVIGQHAGRLAVMLDLARDHLAIGTADLRPQQPDPAVIEIVDIDDLARH
jgi:hypothetical protein